MAFGGLVLHLHLGFVIVIIVIKTKREGYTSLFSRKDIFIIVCR